MPRTDYPSLAPKSLTASRNLRNIATGNITGNLDIGGDVNLTGTNKTFKIGGVGITSQIAALSIALGG